MASKDEISGASICAEVEAVVRRYYDGQEAVAVKLRKIGGADLAARAFDAFKALHDVGNCWFADSYEAVFDGADPIATVFEDVDSTRALLQLESGVDRAVCPIDPALWPPRLVKIATLLYTKCPDYDTGTPGLYLHTLADCARRQLVAPPATVSGHVVTPAMAKKSLEQLDAYAHDERLCDADDKHVPKFRHIDGLLVSPVLLALCVASRLVIEVTPDGPYGTVCYRPGVPPTGVLRLTHHLGLDTWEVTWGAV